jgi:catechol 2,3-dioxygenase-like lactoylglutathione lyase family enzyme
VKQGANAVSTQTAEPSPLDSIHHLAIAVTDVPTSVAWYQAQFNCTVAYQDTTWALLKFANISLALVIPDQHPPHVGFVVENAERFGALTTHRDGTRSVYVDDPDGNSLEMMARERVRPS